MALFRPATKHLPVTGLRIDTAHPLAQGLIACYVPGVMGGIDLVGGLNLTFSASCYPDIGQEGPILGTLNTGTAGAYYDSVPADHAWRSFTTLTLYWRGVTPPAGGTLQVFPARLFALEYANNDSSPYLVASLCTYATSDPMSWNAVWNTAGVFAFAPASGGVAFNRLPWSAAATFVPNGNVISYLNGIAFDTTAFGGGAPTYSATSTVDLTGELSVGASGLGSMIACAWNRTLTAAEIAAFDANPYQFLMPAEGEMPVFSTAFASAVTTAAFSIPHHIGRKVRPMVGY